MKCSGNWMWPAKLPGEGASLYDACTAMCDMLSSLGVAVDGGKDSLSMAARVNDEVVKAPGDLVISVYAPCPDIRMKVTPNFQCPYGKGVILYMRMSSCDQFRLGGSALAQVYNQIGEKTPDVEDPKVSIFLICTAKNRQEMPKIGSFECLLQELDKILLSKYIS